MVVVVVVIYAVAPFKTKTGDCREENRGLSGDKSTPKYIGVNVEVEKRIDALIKHQKSRNKGTCSQSL